MQGESEGMYVHHTYMINQEHMIIIMLMLYMLYTYVCYITAELEMDMDVNDMGVVEIIFPRTCTLCLFKYSEHGRTACRYLYIHQQKEYAQLYLTINATFITCY